MKKVLDKLIEKCQEKHSAVPQHGNFDQRKYGDAYYDKFFDNIGE